MNPATPELIDASREFLALIFAVEVEKQRAADTDARLDAAIAKATARLDRAVQACGEMERIAGDSHTVDYKTTLIVANAAGELPPDRHCPWLTFWGNAGTLEYATQVCHWMTQEFGGDFRVCDDNGWHYVEAV